MSPILQVSDVHFSYGRTPVLFGPSLHVDRGEALALLGPNGAGKTTLLRVIAGLETPASGCVRLDGRDITGRAAEEIVDSGMVLVPGGNAVFTDMTVRENLEIQGHTLRRRPTELQRRLDEVVATFPRLGERWRQLAGTLSGGEQQQLALAKGILLQPSLLVIDELSLGLAPVVVADLLVAVRRMHESGVSVLLVEQSLNIAAQLCSRAVFLEKGVVKFEGSPRELLERDDVAQAVFLGGGRADR